MTINVTDQVNRMAGDIESAVSGSLTRTMSLPAASAQDFGHATLASWVDAGTDGVESALHALARDANAKAQHLRGVAADFATTDADAGSSFGPAGGPR